MTNRTAARTASRAVAIDNPERHHPSFVTALFGFLFSTAIASTVLMLLAQG